jgi:hypothetical protein
MRRLTSLKAAVFAGAAGLLLSAGALHAQVVNPNFELPADGATGTDSVATGWTLSPAVGDNYTNPGARCQFSTQPTPSGGSWSFWEQTFVQQGTADQKVPVTAGMLYQESAQLQFQPGFNGITLANQASDPKSTNTADGSSYLKLQFQDSTGHNIGAADITSIFAGTVATPNVFAPYSVFGVAPVGATQVDVVLGWANGGLDGNQGGQSVFATSVGLVGGTVPEPASLSMLAIGGIALAARRRRA